MLIFDTLEYSERLQTVGFTSEQAKVQAETLKTILDDNIATKRDIEELRVELKRDIMGNTQHIEGVRVELKRDIEELRVELKHDIMGNTQHIEGVRVELKRDIEELRVELKRDLEEMGMKLTIRLGGMMVVAVGAVATLVKLL
ncbi:hypothetical protein WDW89_20870 [Deltaproteobacteria bacterium TL4]